ncbi:SAM-dependent chlorinase/fluorinase, partial [Candidatus Amoebophilus asiaticus]|nr:SAM-dependent chlorinase/fluorinase [Candidatus Amoebophilus asiaticus]
DNGIFSLIFEKKPDKIVELTISQDTDLLTFPTKDVFVKAACHLARGGTLDLIGKEIEKVKELSMLRPVVEDSIIKGTVIYVDSYGNVFTNITRSLIGEISKERKCIVNYSRNESIEAISETYSTVMPGERLCLYSSSGNLEIAINQGNASDLLGLTVGDIIRIEFHDN